MAQPTGSILVRECNLEVGSKGSTVYKAATPMYLYLIVRLPVHPAWLLDDGISPEQQNFTANSHLPQRIKTTQNVYLDTASDKLYSKGYTATPWSASWSHTHTGAVGPAWQTADEDTNYQIQCATYTLYPGADPMLIGIVELKLYCDDAGPTGEAHIEAINVETVMDNDETDLNEWLSFVSRLYEPDYPASSWMVADVLIGGYLHAIGDTITSVCVPVCGRDITPS